VSGVFTRFFYDTSVYSQSKPYALSAIPLDENNVALYWKGPNSQTSYAIYRGITDSDKSKPLFLEKIAAKITENEFLDENVTKGKTYWYVISISSLYEARIPIETVEDGLGLSELVSAVPDAPPKLKSAKYLKPNRVCLEFDKPMSKSVRNVNLYSLIDLSKSQEEKFHPSSVISVETEQKVILTFEEGILMPGHVYKLVIGELRSKNRIAFDSTHELQFTVPKSESFAFQTLSKAIVYPNPIKPNQHDVGYITFANLPVGTKIRIYNVSGALLEELKVTGACRGKRLWYLTNHDKYEISSGIYVYTLEFNREFRKGKIAIIK